MYRKDAEYENLGCSVSVTNTTVIVGSNGQNSAYNMENFILEEFLATKK